MLYDSFSYPRVSADYHNVGYIRKVCKIYFRSNGGYDLARNGVDLDLAYRADIKIGGVEALCAARGVDLVAYLNAVRALDKAELAKTLLAKLDITRENTLSSLAFGVNAYRVLCLDYGCNLAPVNRYLANVSEQAVLCDNGHILFNSVRRALV